MFLLHTALFHDNEPFLFLVGIDSTILYSLVEMYKE
jgi:hypothetical protein